jgi:hypothetical protein
MDRHKPDSSHEATPPPDAERRKHPAHDEQVDEQVDELDEHPRGQPNPPRTTSGKMTSPKFGSAGSGGAELEPGPERD